MDYFTLVFTVSFPIILMLGLVSKCLMDINRAIRRQNAIKLMEIELEFNVHIEIDGNTWKATSKKGGTKEYGDF